MENYNKYYTEEEVLLALQTLIEDGLVNSFVDPDTGETYYELTKEGWDYSVNTALRQSGRLN